MSKPLNLRLKDYIKAVEICIQEKYEHLKHGYSGGSAYSFEVFEKKDDDQPAIVWQIHFGRSKKREVWSTEDLKKIYDKTGVAKERFLEVLKKITGRSY